MGLIKTPWTQQPQKSAAIDWSNPLARGLVLCIVGDTELLSGTKATYLTNGFYRVSSVGRSIDSQSTTNGGAYFQLPANHPVYTIGNRCSLLSYGTASSAVEYAGAWSIPFSTSGWASPYVAMGFKGVATINQAAFVFAEGTTYRADASGPINYWVKSSPTLYAVTRDGTATKYLRSDGSFVTSSLVSSAAPNFVNKAPVHVLNRSYGSPAEGLVGTTALVMAYNRPLSEVELTRLRENPWQIFKPISRRIFVPVSSGGLYTLTAQSGSYSLAGNQATLLRHRSLSAEAGAYSISGQVASLYRNRVLSAASGSYAISGQSAVLSKTTLSVVYSLTALPGSYSFTGSQATLLRHRTLTAQPGAYSYTGQPITISKYTQGESNLVLYLNVLTGEVLALKPLGIHGAMKDSTYDSITATYDGLARTGKYNGGY